MALPLPRHPGEGRGPEPGTNDSSLGLGPGLRRDDEEEAIVLLALDPHERAAMDGAAPRRKPEGLRAGRLRQNGSQRLRSEKRM
jgi:hypothetical protein